MNLLQPYTAPRQGDPYWDNVVLHLKAKGANASTVFGDAKGHPITPYGNAQISTGQSKFGGAAMYFDGTGDYLEITATADFTFGTGDFTVECWAWCSSGASYPSLVNNDANYASGATGAFLLQLYPAGTVLFGFKKSVSYTEIAGTTNICNSAWHHVAVSRSGTSLRLFVDGVSEATTTSSENMGLSNALLVGAYTGATYTMNGYIDDLRITKGVARYTANFTPPAAPNPIGILRSPLDVLLMPFNGANGSTAFHDQTGKAVTAYGDANIITTGTQKFGSYMSLYPFTNSVSRVETPDTNDLRLTGDFTIDFWVAVSTTTQNTIPLNKSASTGRSYIQYYNDNVYVVNDAATAVFSAVALNLTINTWYHFAVCKAGSLWYLFLNGTQLGGTQTNTGTFGDNSGPLRIGNYVGDGYVFNGYLDDLRITKGLARYTQNFDPPSRSFEQLYDPYTDWTKDPYLGNVVLHCPFNESVGDTKGHTVTAYGNAAVSATQSKLGGKSCYFDGTGDYLLVPDMAFGYSDFTIEFWMYTGTNNTEPLSTYSAGGWQFYINGSTMRFYKASNTPLITGTTNVCSSTWVHVAVTRSGTTARMFINGTQEGGDQTDSSNYNDTNMYVGSYDGTSYYFNGYLDDLRITKGIARYTANFTPEARQSPEY